MNKAQGRFITFLDSDDLWLPNFLETTINYLIENNEELVYSSYKRVDENLKPLLADFIAVDKVDRNRILYNCPIPMLTSVYDSKRIGKIPVPDVELREDHAMWIDLLGKIKYARAINESLAIYRIRNNSVSRNKLRIAKKQYKILNTKTTFDWLSRSSSLVDTYIKDPYCGYICTTSFYNDLFHLTLNASKPECIKKTRRNLPLLIISGDKDPVSAYGTQISKYFLLLQRLGFKSVDCTLYSEGRHELLNELNNDDIMRDIKDWIERILI